MEKVVQTMRKQIEGVSSLFTLDACRHGGMTELEEAELTDGQGRVLSGHKTTQAYKGYAKETMQRALAATRKRHAHLLTQRQLEQAQAKAEGGEQISTEFRNKGAGRFEIGTKSPVRAKRSSLPGQRLRVGWGAKIRTREWRNQNLLDYSTISTRIWKKQPKCALGISICWLPFPNENQLSRGAANPPNLRACAPHPQERRCRGASKLRLGQRLPGAEP
jgi:hypothetical protein